MVNSRLGADEVRRSAAEGVASGGSVLPHLERIQEAFGRHDLSSVRAHIGGAASEAAAAIGARAYAFGERIAFGAWPDLFTAAHEAAHIVQQRVGVRTSDGVGRAGDRYERQADAVATAVVQGHSAELLLGRPAASTAGVGPATAAIQRLAFAIGRDAWDIVAAEQDGQLEVVATPGRRGQRMRVDDLCEALGLQQGALTAGSASNHFNVAAGFEAQVRTALGHAGSGGPNVAFADRFNSVFVNILHAFPNTTTPSVQGLTQATATAMFTNEQRSKLTSFMQTGEIPSRLFNGAATTRTPPSPAQRLLIAAHILQVGRYVPGQLPTEEAEVQATTGESVEGTPGSDAAPDGESGEQAPAPRPGQEIQARNCRHFATLVHSYAGIHSSADHDGIIGRFDHEGNLVMSQGGHDRVGTGSATGVVTRQDGTPENAPVHDPDSLRPGDWLEMAWGPPSSHPERDNGGGHSIILARVLNPRINAHLFKIAFYDQHGPARDAAQLGARRYYELVMSRQTRRGKPVIFARTRVADNAGPVTSAEGLLGAATGGADGDNQTFLVSKLPRASQGSEEALVGLTRRFAGWLHERNETFITTIGGRATDAQRATLRSINVRVSETATLDAALTAVQQLVRLYEHLAYVAHQAEELGAADERQGSMRHTMSWQVARNIGREEFQGRPEPTGAEPTSSRVTGIISSVVALRNAPWATLRPEPAPEQAP